MLLVESGSFFDHEPCAIGIPFRGPFASRRLPELQPCGEVHCLSVELIAIVNGSDIIALKEIGIEVSYKVSLNVPTIVQC